MPVQLARNRLPEVGSRALVALLTQPLVDGHQGAAQPPLRGLALQAHQPPSAAPAVVGQAEKVQRPRVLSCVERTRHAVRLPNATSGVF
jgi:hypothetical protein